MTAGFTLRSVGMRFGAAEVLRDATLELFGPGLVSIVGPNGAGKSTLLGILSGLRHGYSGSCRYEGTELAQWNRRSLARRLSFMPQSLRLEFPFTAEQVVYMGRTPFCAGLFESPEDRDAVERALDLTDSGPFRNRDFRSLSGGEKQRVILARALAQQPLLLLLDEPTLHLDIGAQVDLLEGLRRLAAQNRYTVVVVTHELNLAAEYADRIALLQKGKCLRVGPPAGVYQRDLLEQVFQTPLTVEMGASGRPRVNAIRPREEESK